MVFEHNVNANECQTTGSVISNEISNLCPVDGVVKVLTPINIACSYSKAEGSVKFLLDP